MNIDSLTMTDAVILSEIGNRLEQLRLGKNLRQKDLSELTGLSVETIRAFEKGKGKLQSLVVLLRGLQALDELDGFIPPAELDPVAIAEMQGKKRQRARRTLG
jgi:transcriptional regulator with XRE-family HTH domain